MKKLIFLTLTALTMIACGDNGVSAPSQICFDKKLTYQDVISPEYRDYADEWNEKACVSKYGSECIYWDESYILTVRECAENVEFH